MARERREPLEEIDPSWCPAWPVTWQRCSHLVRQHLDTGETLPTTAGEVMPQGEDIGRWVTSRPARVGPAHRVQPLVSLPAKEGPATKALPSGAPRARRTGPRRRGAFAHLCAWPVQAFGFSSSSAGPDGRGMKITFAVWQQPCLRPRCRPALPGFTFSSTAASCRPRTGTGMAFPAPLLLVEEVALVGGYDRAPGQGGVPGPGVAVTARGERSCTDGDDMDKRFIRSSVTAGRRRTGRHRDVVQWGLRPLARAMPSNSAARVVCSLCRRAAV